MKQKATIKSILRAWFPNRLNITVALLLLPFWLVVALGFFSMLFHAYSYSQAKHHTASMR